MPAHRFPVVPRLKYDRLTCPRYTVGLRLPFERREPPVEFVLDTGADVSLYPRPAADAQGLVYDRRRTADDDLPVTIRGPLSGILVEVNVRLLVEPNGGDRIDERFRLPLFLYDPPPAGPPPGPGVPTAAVPADLDEWEARQQELLRGGGRPSADSGADGPLILGSLGFLTRFRVLLTPRWLVLATDDTSLDRAVGLARAASAEPGTPAGASILARTVRWVRGR